jgi:membrane protein DedA with SNARE-associated domain
MNLIELIIDLAQQNKYPLLFIIYLIEGPISGFISAIIASTGGLNIFIVFTLLVTGEIGADIVYYYIGKYSSETKLNKKLAKYEDRGILKEIKETFARQPVKALIFIKTVMFIAIPSLLLIGRYRSLEIKKFLLWTTIICLVKDITVLFLGYGLGISLEVFLKGYDIYRIIAIILTLLVIGYILFKVNRDKIEKFTINLLRNIK